MKQPSKTSSRPRYETLSEFCLETRTKKIWLASQLGVSRFQMAGLLYPDRYPVVLTTDLANRLARLLNQSPDYIRKQYEDVAA